MDFMSTVFTYNQSNLFSSFSTDFLPPNYSLNKGKIISRSCIYNPSVFCHLYSIFSGPPILNCFLISTVNIDKQQKHRHKYNFTFTHQIQKSSRFNFLDFQGLGKKPFQNISYCESENGSNRNKIEIKQVNKNQKSNGSDCLGCKIVGCVTMFAVSGYLFLQSNSLSNRNPSKHRTFLVVSSGFFAILGVGRALL